MGINRYSNIVYNGQQQMMPKVTISKRASDKFAIYHPEKLDWIEYLEMFMLMIHMAG